MSEELERIAVTIQDPPDKFEFHGTVTHPINCPQCLRLVKDCICPKADDVK